MNSLEKVNTEISTEDLFLKVLNQKSKNTIQSYKQDVSSFENFVGIDLRKATEQDFISYYEYCKNEQKQGKIRFSTINRRIASLSTILSKMIALRLRETHPVNTLKTLGVIKTFRIKKAVTLAFDKADINKVLDYARDNKYSSYLVLKVLLNTGLRISPVLDIKVQDFKEYDHNLMSVRVTSKGDVEGEKFISRKLYQEIIKYFTPDQDGYIFTSYKKSSDSLIRLTRTNETKKIKQIFSLILGVKATAHTMRHFFATYLLQQGKSLKAVSRQLDHASTKITADIYQHSEFKPGECMEF